VIALGVSFFPCCWLAELSMSFVLAKKLSDLIILPVQSTLIPNCPIGCHTGEGRYPAMKNTPRSEQSHDVAPLAWEIFDHLDSGLRRNDVFFSNGQFGLMLCFRHLSG
jgi:hypothetical protein